jgi:hypothetical protein
MEIKKKIGVVALVASYYSPGLLFVGIDPSSVWVCACP